jgi:hypothetical protein
LRRNAPCSPASRISRSTRLRERHTPRRRYRSGEAGALGGGAHCRRDHRAEPEAGQLRTGDRRADLGAGGVEGSWCRDGRDRRAGRHRRLDHRDADLGRLPVRACAGAGGQPGPAGDTWRGEQERSARCAGDRRPDRMRDDLRVIVSTRPARRSTSANAARGRATTRPSLLWLDGGSTSCTPSCAPDNPTTPNTLPRLDTSIGLPPPAARAGHAGPARLARSCLRPACGRRRATRPPP